MAKMAQSMYFLIIIIASCTVVRTSRILLMPLFGNSDYFIFKKIATELSNRGHEVKLLTASNLKHFIGTSNISHLIYEAPQSLNEVEDKVEKITQDPIVSRVFAVFPFAVLLKFQQMVCRDFLNNTKILQEVKDFRADLLVSDVVFMCNPILQEILSIPRVDVSPSGIIPFFMQSLQIPCPVSYTPQMGTDSTDEMSFFERVHNMAMYIVSEFLREFFLYKPFGDLKKEFKISPERSFSEALQNGEMLLVQADFALDIPRPLPPAVKMIGAVLPEPAQPLPADLEQFMQSSGDHGVILVTFGSMVSKLDASILKKMTVVFGRLKQKILWKVKREALPLDVSSNIKAVKWLPQNDVLGHHKTRLFISHMGHNGMYEALYHGVPLVACPLFGDQFSNTNLVVRAGVGSKVILRTISEDELEKVIRSVLDDSQFKSKASHLSNLMRDRPRTPLQESADSIEYVLRNGNLRHLRVRSFDLPWYQYYLVDVMLFIAALVTAVVFVLAFFCRCCCNLLCRRRLGKQKAE
ncbi:UDP-glucuronosyltransferase 1-2-like isoform X1 [Actinia tenebrosa]|uniref:UDP-glucuronosyltransferase 1-2-like isoform X1 n=1 Tax=Actinia tenebrosa TaxID=6105 RepID=A0A6P8I889_ACTTE|nr:UDP-glucuronosyltransferase 1-2-like isoform X1 [Actinia tenebrosa]